MIEIEVSIVIPVYNADKTLYMCLTSILASNYPKESLEIIVVDNNSTDDSGLIIDQFNVKKLFEKKQGRSIARNTGIKEARGMYIGFLDSDTEIDENWISEMVSTLKKGQIGGVAGQVRPSGKFGQVRLFNYRKWLIGESTNKTWNILKLKVRESPMINSAACMYRKEALELVNGFDERLKRHEDIDLSKRVLYAGYDLSVVDKAIVKVEYHGEGWFSYFLRSFQDGLTKGDYLRKWNAEVELISSDDKNIKLGAEEITNRLNSNLRDKNFEESKLSRVFKEKAYSSVYIIYTLKELCWDFYSIFRFLDIYHGIKLVNDILRILGRLTGLLKSNPFDKKLLLNIRPKSARQRIVEFGRDKSFLVNDYIRFVLLTDSYYLIDIRDHTILEDRSKAPVVYYVWKMLFQDFQIEFADSCNDSFFEEQDILMTGPEVLNEI